MTNNTQNGFYLFHKTHSTDNALKEMLQFLRSSSPGRNLQFSFVEAETSLLPHLTLWENVHVVFGGQNWKELVAHLEVEWQPLVMLIKNPDLLASQASPWDRLTVGLIMATLIKSQHLLVDINEAIYSQLNLMNFKKMLVIISQQKNVFVATANTSVWLDSSHGLIKRDGYEFCVEALGQSNTKRQRTA